jgi:hypothetical protein
MATPIDRKLQNVRRSSSRPFFRPARGDQTALAFECLEDRRLLSAVHFHPSYVLIKPAQSNGLFSPSALTPNQIRGAYGLGTFDTSGALSNAILFQGVAGEGAGQTIAIADAFDDLNAVSDINTFSANYNLPQFNVAGGPTFTKLNEYGGAVLPPVDPAGQYNGGTAGDWEVEESLDVEWAHAIAPLANIILFEANGSDVPDLLQAAQTAAATPGVVVVSMSFGQDEFSGEGTWDADFTTPAGHLGGAAALGGADLPGGVTFLAAAGDDGAYGTSGQTNTSITPQYPASSPNVVAVGGTSLYPNGDSYGSETTWGNGTSSGTQGGGGGGISGTSGINGPESQPVYQNGVVNAYSTTQRTYPDVSADASPTTGVPIYDSYVTSGVNPWLTVGGTSLSCPLWAGMVALADQGRALVGLGSLDGPSQTLSTLYSLPSADFHSITSGNATGPSPTYSPVSGYDLATGLGSPVGNLLIPQLAGPDRLAFQQGPSNSTAGAGILPSITVDVEDSLGNIVTTDNSIVTLSIGSNPGAGNLLGTRTVTAVNGVATFSGLAIDAVGSGYTLVASDGGLTTAISAPFSIGANPAQPAVVNTAGASPAIVSGTTTNLSVLGSDPTGEANLTYTWSTVTWPASSPPPTFAVNQSNAAKSTLATFYSAGLYELLVTITNAGGLSVGSTVTVSVGQTLTALRVSPGPVTLAADSQDRFSAAGLDQFGNSMAAPAGVTWTAASGAITSAGMYTPPPAGGSDLVTATSGSFSGTSSVTIAAPVGWWKLNDGLTNPASTTAADSSSNGDTGVISKATWLQPPLGVNGMSALEFNNGSVKIGSPPALAGFLANNQITLAAWIDPATMAAGQYILDYRTSSSNDLFLMITSSGLYEIGTDIDGSVRGASAPIPSGDLNTWVHLAGTYDGSTWRLYRDGQLIGSALDATGVSGLLGSPVWTIGGASSGSYGPKNFFQGAIDDGRIYATAINSSAIGGLEAVPPTVQIAASAAPNPVTGTTTTLSALGADDAGPSTLIYTWATVGTPPAAVHFSVNGTNVANSTAATFTRAGVYNLQVTITNVAGLTAVSSFSVTVNQTLTGITVGPLSGVQPDGTQPFVATALDQFGIPLANQPQFSWSVLGGGSITSTGVFTPPYAAGAATVQATSGSLTGSDNIAFPGVAQWAAIPNASWNTASSWTSSVFSTAVGSPGLRGVAGDGVLLNAPGGGEVDLDGVSPILADVTFDSAGSYTIGEGSGGTLELAGGTSPATLTVIEGTHTISAPLTLQSDIMLHTDAGGRLTLSGGITGPGHMLTVDGQGAVVLKGIDNYSGGTTVSTGLLVLGDSAAIAAGSNLTVGAGAASIFAAPAVAANAAAIAATSSPASTTTAASSPTIASEPTRPSLAPGALEPKYSPSLPPWKNIPTAPPRNSTVSPLSGSVTSRLVAPPMGLPQFETLPGLSDQNSRHELSIAALDALFARYE